MRLKLSGYRPVVRTYEVDGWEGQDLGRARYYINGIRSPRWLWVLLSRLGVGR